MVSVCENKKGRFLPKSFDVAHRLCFVIHDVMCQIITSGEEGNFFTTTIELKNKNEREALNNIDDFFALLESEERFEDRAEILRTVVLPAVLSDMMHCIFESLESSRKAKLGVSYMLIRKPLQESLYLLESVVLDESDFAKKLVEDPLKLRPSNAGGVEDHGRRIKKVLEIISETPRLDADYIAQLRYDKKKEDSFDGACNHAMHLFTQHEAIRTENLNINFIFSGWEEKITQWSYFYSRLPYLLFYTHKMVEHIVERIVPTSQEYLDDIQRRLSALIILWWEGIDEQYTCDQLMIFVKETESWLKKHCKSAGHRIPNNKDLWRMSKTGAFPKENIFSVKARALKYEARAAINKIYAN
ncbi:MAG: hypothetical protein P9X22_00570 [Candidatus Zapsychrus exili]|nr:hypothetical protein [Candidatus Zapsychrus exili]